MKRHPHEHPMYGSTVDEYLDDTLSPEDRHTFEQRLAQDDDLRELVDMQHRIAASIRRNFIPDDAPVPLRTQVPGHRLAGRLQFNRQFLSATAAVLLLLISGWMIWHAIAPSRPEIPNRPFKPESMLSVYQSHIQQGFVPLQSFQGNSDFRDTMVRNLGVALIPSRSNGVEVLGFSSGRTIDVCTVCLLANVNDQNVMVFLARGFSDTKPSIPDDCGLHLHRAERDGLVLYELSPIPEAKVIPIFKKVSTCDPIEETEQLPSVQK